MKARAMQTMALSVSALVALAVSMVMTPLDGTFLCIAPGGHSEVEFSPAGCCLPPSSFDEIAVAPVEAATRPCGDCVDLPLLGSTGCLRLMRPALPDAETNHLACSLRLGEGNDREGRGEFGGLVWDRCFGPLASLSTVVLLT